MPGRELLSMAIFCRFGEGLSRDAIDGLLFEDDGEDGKGVSGEEKPDMLG
jgi:hypothetical protein